jgi:hypothetical protein
MTKSIIIRALLPERAVFAFFQIYLNYEYAAQALNSEK